MSESVRRIRWIESTHADVVFGEVVVDVVDAELGAGSAVVVLEL